MYCCWKTEIMLVFKKRVPKNQIIQKKDFDDQSEYRISAFLIWNTSYKNGLNPRYFLRTSFITFYCFVINEPANLKYHNCCNRILPISKAYKKVRKISHFYFEVARYHFSRISSLSLSISNLSHIHDTIKCCGVADFTDFFLLETLTKYTVAFLLSVSLCVFLSLSVLILCALLA